MSVDWIGGAPALKFRPRRQVTSRAWVGIALGLALLPGSSLFAADLYQDGDFDIRWDNTIRYSAAFRLEGRNDALLANPNGDDGDRNFSPGLISNRLDLLSEADISDGAFGVHASAAAWYDSVYNQRNANDWPSTFNPWSVPHNEFTHDVQVLHGEDVQILNAFGYGSFDLGGMPVSFRIGRHALQWGESLFFAENGIAAGQSPIDEIKAANEPSAEAKEVLLPVPQASITLQPRANIAVSAYYQFEWRKDQQNGSGSYFSAADYLGDGGERYIFAANEYLYRVPDRSASASGQYGVSLHVNTDAIDYGLYALRFNAKEPEVYLAPGVTTGPGGTLQIVNPSLVDLSIGKVGDYGLIYPQGIQLYGASFAGYLGDSAIAGEISARRNMPLVSGLSGALAGNGAGGYNAAFVSHYSPPGQSSAVPTISPDSSYASGDTLHAQMSTVTTLSPGALWDGADLSAEFAANDRLDVSNNPSALATTRSRFALAFRGVFEPQYFQVSPGLDLTVPFGVGYGLVGRSSTDASQNAGAGDVELGVSATYRTVWQAGITYTHFVGSPARQPFADRDFIVCSLQRTF
jgi:hypothetical protein